MLDPDNLPIVDRLVQFDERSKLYRAVERIPAVPLRSYTWSCGVHNDQGQEGACVGFAWSHEIAARPVPIPTDNAWALRIYNRAKQIDPWEGEDYSGTSVLAGVQAVQEIVNRYGTSLIEEYRWAFGIEDVLRVLGTRGPMVLGVWWHYSFYFPDENGFIHPDDNLVGGHAILANGVRIVRKDPTKIATWDNVDLDRSYVRLHNSWGTGYGINGDCFISVRDLANLLNNEGEACIPVRRAVR